MSTQNDVDIFLSKTGGKGMNNEVELIYGINNIPDNFIIDENRIIVGRNLSSGFLKKTRRIIQR